MDGVKVSEIRRDGVSGLTILWSTGLSSRLSAKTLRAFCPCAGCREARGEALHDSPLTPRRKSLLSIVESTVEEETRLERIWGIGQYAIGIQWGDGHSTGIYTFDLLRQLAESTHESQGGSTI